MKKNIYSILAALILTASSFAQTTDNAELQKMYDEDQAARLAGNINWKVLIKEDSIRLARNYEMVKEGKVITGKDHYNSAMIFQHGNDTLASSMAVRQMRRALELDTTINRWLLAAAIDRDLMRRGKPQIYGTQYVKLSQDTRYRRYQIDTTQVTDAQRKYYGVETLAEQLEKERTMNLTPVSQYYASENSVDKTVALIKAEMQKGKRSNYDVSEAGINSFGYQLLGDKKPEEALKIFRLNTELYPQGFNTFDSYGECLMLLNKKSEALKAYKKSLDLNPQNDNARKILADNK